MARGKRETFILNPLNPKDKLILDFLEKQFNRSEAIRDILFQYLKDNVGNADITALPINDNNITMPLSNDDNTVINALPNNDKSVITPLQQDDNGFNIDINSIDDNYVEIGIENKEVNANEEALNYLNNWR